MKLPSRPSFLYIFPLSPLYILLPVPRTFLTRISLQLNPLPDLSTRLNLFPPPGLPTETLDRLDLVPPLGGHHVGQVGPAVAVAAGVEGDVDSVSADFPVEGVAGWLEGR